MERENKVLSEGKDLQISHRLVDWYKKHKRDLPWRETRDPYIIWISEIILQQTRVAQGMDYFLRFTERFPDILSLATAEEDEVLKFWQGLGYYSRARNLHTAAKDILKRFGGTFPDEYPDILSLKGIGEYTAAAIISSAWNKSYAVVDGNVFRVISRLFAVDTPIDSTQGKKQFVELANYLLDPSESRLHNQAMMELGALQCVPQNPECGICPLSDKCLAFASGNVQRYPVKQNKAKSRDRYFHYFHIIYKNETWLRRREGKDIWNGLYEFPLIETEKALSFEELQQTDSFHSLFGDAGNLEISIEQPKEKHILSHQVLYTTFYRIRIGIESKALRDYIRIPIEDIEKYAVPRLIHIYLEKLEPSKS